MSSSLPIQRKTWAVLWNKTIPTFRKLKRHLHGICTKTSSIFELSQKRTRTEVSEFQKTNRYHLQQEISQTNQSKSIPFQHSNESARKPHKGNKQTNKDYDSHTTKATIFFSMVYAEPYGNRFGFWSERVRFHEASKRVWSQNPKEV